MPKRSTARDYPRTARLNTLVRDILARELGRIDDERLEFVTLTSVVVDGDLKKAVAYYDHSRGDEADEEVADAFDAADTAFALESLDHKFSASSSARSRKPFKSS